MEQARENHARVVEQTKDLSKLLDCKVQALIDAENGLLAQTVSMQTYQNVYNEWRKTHDEWYTAVTPTLIELNRLTYTH